MPYNAIAKVLQSNCRQTTTKYVPDHSMWLERIFSDLANTDERHCLTIGCIGVNKNGPGRYKMQTDDLEKGLLF